MSSETASGTAGYRAVRWLFRILAVIAGGAYVFWGLVFGAVFLIALAWSGNFERLGFIAGILIYLFGVALLSFFYAVVPKRALGWLLLLLYVPGAVGLGYHHAERKKLRGVSTAFARGTDLATIASAREELEAIGRRSGRQPHIDGLLAALAGAEDDGTRLRIVEMLGRLSYQYGPVLETLRNLRDETRGAPDRQELHDAVVEAMLGVNPYEPMYGPGGSLTLDQARAAEAELESRLVGQFFDQVDREIAAVSGGIDQLADWSREVEPTEWAHGGKHRDDAQVRYARTWNGPNAGDGDCRIEIFASPVTQPLEIPEAYRSRAIVVEMASHRITAWVITSDPELPGLERRILDVVRSSATEAATVWDAREKLPA